MLAKCKYGKNLFLIPSKVELHLNAVNVVNYYAHLTHFLAALIEGWVGLGLLGEMSKRKLAIMSLQ